MKFIIDTKILLNKLSLSNQLVDNSNLNPTLSGILVTVNKNEIILTSSNSTCSSKIFIKDNFEVESEGSFLIKGKTFYEIINKLTDKKVKLEIIDNTMLRISTKIFSCNLCLLDTNSYPTISFDYSNWEEINIDKHFFQKINSKLATFIDSNGESLNPDISGILIDTTRYDNKIESMATNGYHLGYLSGDYTGPKIKIVINPNNVKFINSIIQEKEKNINFFLKESKIIVRTNENLFLFKLVESRYPSAYKVIEAEYAHSFVIKKNLLSEAINRAMVIAQGNKSPEIKLTIQQDKILLTSKSNEYGNSFEELAIEEVEIDKEYEFTFNLKYLSNILKTLDNEKIQFNFISENKQAIFTNDNSKEFKALILPIA